MKRKLLLVSAFILSLSAANAQEVMDAGKLSRTELTGTARAMSMGGAFGALGGDITAIAINPAGIGVYQSSEIVTTLNFQNQQSTAAMNLGDWKNNQFRVNFNNLGFVGTVPINSDVAPLINFGFSYNRLMDFDRKYSVGGAGLSSSLSDLMALNANGYTTSQLSDAGTNDPWINGPSWLGILGYNSGLISPIAGGKNQYQSNVPLATHIENELFVREKGSVNTYDFNVGTTFEDMLSVGLTLSVTDIDYRQSSSYFEYFYPDQTDRYGSYGLYNDLKTEGTGWGLGLGVIFKPIHELRIGVAYHSPTWYNMTDIYGVDLSHNFSDIKNDMGLAGTYKPAEVSSGDWLQTDYKYRTPDRWVFSLAGVLGSKAIISMDYELTDYSKTKFTERFHGVSFDDVNSDIKSSYRLASTLRLGAEYRITSQFSGRIGYSWQQSPYKTEFEDFMRDGQFNNQVYTAGSIPQFVSYGDTNYITWGLGYRFTKNFYTDLAFVYKSQKSDLFAYSKSDVASLKTTTFQGVLTFGFRF